MGCCPSNKIESILEVKKERPSSSRATISSAHNINVDPHLFQHINISLFIIGEENSKYEESHIPSNIGTLLTPQLTDQHKE